MTENLIDLFLVLFLFMMTQNSTGTGCQQWSLLSAALSSPLASAGPLVSALAVYLWWKLVRRMTAWKFRWQRRSVKFRLDDTLLVLLLHCLSTRRKKKKRWKTVENTPFLDLSIPFASDSVFWFIPPPPPITYRSSSLFSSLFDWFITISSPHHSLLYNLPLSSLLLVLKKRQTFTLFPNSSFPFSYNSRSLVRSAFGSSSAFSQCWSHKNFEKRSRWRITTI